ncbi:MAG TPA: rod shape-determining protein MreC [Dehalococcoidia bacterium]|nr:rod shape-determining protein MreC [Dehalococcoidia bacterium]
MSLTRPITWFISVLLLGLGMVAFSHAPGSAEIRGITQVATSPLEDSLHSILSPIAIFITTVSSYGDLRSQNQRLEADNQRLVVQVAQLQEQLTQSGQLGDLAQVAGQHPDVRYVGATVVARDPSNLHDQIEVDRGSTDGIHPGMTVVGSGGALVGTVRQSLPNRAWVALVTDSQSNINAVIQQSRALAILRGSVDRQLTMQFVAEGVDVKVGDTVMTSGLGGGYPAGYLLGHVSSVQGQPVDLFKRVTVEPAARLDSLEHVLIQSSFTPASGGG